MTALAMTRPRMDDGGRTVRAVLRGHNGWVVHTTFSPDGRTIATGANDGRVLLWRVWHTRRRGWRRCRPTLAA